MRSCRESGETQRAISQVLNVKNLNEDVPDEEPETVEDQIEQELSRTGMAKNASYFAFTATPKNKTLEIFGEVYSGGGPVKHRPFHSYTMKQAIQEGFILDVLKYYTVRSISSSSPWAFRTAAVTATTMLLAFGAAGSS